MHYRRWKQWGDPLATRSTRDRRLKDGYVELVRKGHPNANRAGRIFEHRLVMSGLLGRPLRLAERVHHRNGNRTDNRPENLELWILHHPAGQKLQDLIDFAKTIIADYGHLDGLPLAGGL